MHVNQSQGTFKAVNKVKIIPLKSLHFKKFSFQWNLTSNSYCSLKNKIKSSCLCGLRSRSPSPEVTQKSSKRTSVSSSHEKKKKKNLCHLLAESNRNMEKLCGKIFKGKVKKSQPTNGMKNTVLQMRQCHLHHFRLKRPHEILL